MNSASFQNIAAEFPRLRVAVVGDFCLDRYLEIDPSRTETSIETGLPVHNVTRVRAQPGAAGTILSTLVALGVGQLHLVGFCGDDGEGYELRRALSALPGVRLENFVSAADRRTFTYCKPLVVTQNEIPQELNRLDSKNWTPTPSHLAERMAAAVASLASVVDAMIVLDQVDLADTGLVTREVLEALSEVPQSVPVIADSRRGLSGYPPVVYKMNAAELATLTAQQELQSIDDIGAAAADLANRNHREVVITMAERGLIGASPDGRVEYVQALPVRGPIDVVGAGDAVTASITAALASGAALREALQLAAAAASVVIHKLGMTGAASVAEISQALTSAE
jgi:rfaE bifunctional protein kinase chain/domain